MKIADLINRIAAEAASNAEFRPTRDPAKNLPAIKAVKDAAEKFGVTRCSPWLPKRQRSYHQLVSAFILS